MSNKYLEKIAALNPIAKQFARKVAGSVAGDSARINNVYNATAGAVRKGMGGLTSAAEKAAVKAKMGEQAAKVVGPGKLYPHEATRAAMVGARAARMAGKSGLKA